MGCPASVEPKPQYGAAASVGRLRHGFLFSRPAFQVVGEIAPSAWGGERCVQAIDATA